MPLTRFPIEQAADAFRHMAQAKHIGKIVLTHPEPEQAAGDPSVGDRGSPTQWAGRPAIRPDASYLITGGLGGLGLLLARWFVDQGARHLAARSRATALFSSPEVREIVKP